ncbi:MAG: folylpolyglutamate synthase/dihydrofolate synthase family protein [Prochloraceae cyanobacterium]|nr:folylpolyglutamate synthase/dihydrofolate synthase family protein [Prochloraceae cyanobacterium]
MSKIDSILKPFQYFGVNLGLERIERLLEKLDNPHQRVPIIHVAGTNGKGSVCAYLSSILAEAGYKVGRYTSPHLVDWTERICINSRSISNKDLEATLLQIQQVIDPTVETPTLFEIVTAAAWLYFAQQKVDVAVMEVGLGGRLDATNVCSRPLVSIIVSISREHWQRLGPTLADITREKAGILKPSCPAVIGKLPAEAKAVVASRIDELNCPVVWVKPAIESNIQREQGIGNGEQLQLDTVSSDTTERWGEYEGREYPLPLLGEVQLMNSAIAIAAIKILQQKGWKIPLSAIKTGMAKTRWSGRLQWTTWGDRPILIDGAHNEAAAIALRQYIDTLNKPVCWVIGILSTKDHSKILKAILRPGDRLLLVPVPDRDTATPEALANIAKNISPELEDCQTFSELFTALELAFENKNNSSELVVLCGSLYLIGYFLKQR